MTANYKHHHDTKQYCELRRSMASSLVHDKSMEDQYATPHSTWTHWPEKGDRTSTDSRPRLENMSTMFRSSASILLVVGCGVTRSGSVLDPQVTVLSLLDVFSLTPQPAFSISHSPDTRTVASFTRIVQQCIAEAGLAQQAPLLSCTTPTARVPTEYDVTTALL